MTARFVSDREMDEEAVLKLVHRALKSLRIATADIERICTSETRGSSDRGSRFRGSSRNG